MSTAYAIDKSTLFEKVGYEPMPHQDEYHAASDEARFRVVSGGRRLGKSQMAGADRVGSLLLPNTLGWIVGPTYDLGSKEFRVIWDLLMVGMKLGHDKRVKGNFSIKQGDMYIQFPWGSRVEVRSATHPESLVGEGLDWAIMSEAAKHDKETWERFIRPALADKRGSADFVSTPEGKNWFYDLWKLGIEGHREYWSRRWPSWVNLEVFPGGEEDPEIQLLRETTIEEWFLQEIAAEFTAVVGRIFSEFSEEVHVKKHVYRPDWPNYMAFDWGFANPLAAVEFQVAPDDTIYVWREHYDTYRTLEWHVQAIKNRSNPEGYRLDMCFGDAADPEAVAYVSQHLAPCLANPDSKQWLSGIRLMKRFLKLNEHGKDEYDRPIMKPKYYVDPDCENHISEMTGYKTRKNVSPNEFNGAGVVASGISDHTVDAVRYGLMHVFEVGVRHHLEDLYPHWASSSPPPVERELVSATSTYFQYNQGRF